MRHLAPAAPDPSGRAAARRSTAIEDSTAPRTELVDRLEQELRALPVRSAAAARVLTTLQDPRSGPAEVAAELETDAALSVRVLHLANSPYYGLVRRVGSVQQAVTVVGFTTVRSIAAATAVGMIGDENSSTSDDLWRHSRACASVVAVIGRHAEVGGTDVLGAALLHDVGTSLLSRLVPDELATALELAAARGMAKVDAEAEVIGMTHAEAGAKALDALGLPQRLIQAVLRHHDAPPGSMAALVAAANEAAHWQERGGDPADAAPVTAALAHLGVAPALHEQVLADIGEHTEGAGRLIALLR